MTGEETKGESRVSMPNEGEEDAYGGGEEEDAYASNSNSRSQAQQGIEGVNQACNPVVENSVLNWLLQALAPTCSSFTPTRRQKGNRDIIWAQIAYKVSREGVDGLYAPPQEFEESGVKDVKTTVMPRLCTICAHVHED
ncbi:hypothetical protein TSUD_242690 [Trifolium subterraneum]|uniref:Uncharacterized protein n=1 Tax=Trifolium subterraneum TaxID=3900 RepID=A0A2Z6MXY7_TRISU|nr:hypothetical protein TSUD_242690 [Trifolium subterraneum]